jgi:hypothetical protein
MFGDLKLKVNLGDRNKTPNRLLIEKMRTNRKGSGLNEVLINQTFVNNSSFNQTDRAAVNNSIHNPVRSPRLNN